MAQESPTVQRNVEEENAWEAAAAAFDGGIIALAGVNLSS
jgi:hypothetical protein